MAESQKEFLFRAMLKELGVSLTGGSSSGVTRHEFIIDKKFLSVFSHCYKIGYFVKKGEVSQYYFYGMPETNQKIVDLLKEHFDLSHVELFMYEDYPMGY